MSQLCYGSLNCRDWQNLSKYKPSQYRRGYLKNVFWTNLGVGLVGALVGGYFFNLLNIDLGLGEGRAQQDVRGQVQGCVQVFGQGGEQESIVVASGVG